MTARYRKFEKAGLAVTRIYDVGPGELDKPIEFTRPVPRRYAVMEFLNLINKEDIYAIVDEGEMGCPITTIVYYRVNNVA